LHNEEKAAFCAECGAFLEWEGKKVEPDPKPEPTAAAASALPTVAATGPASIHESGTPTLETPEVEAPKAENAGSDVVRTAEALLAEPEAVKPGRPITRPPVPRHDPAPVQTATPGEVTCRTCGAGNDPGRHLCQRCGTSLEELSGDQPLQTPAPERVPWWRKIRPPGAGAGKRKARDDSSGRPKIDEALIKRAIAVAVTIGVLLCIVVPGIRRPIKRNANSLMGKIVYHYTLADVTSADAFGNDIGGHAALNVFEGDAKSFWAAPAAKPGTPARIRLFLDRPSDVALIRITPGDPNNFLGSARPRRIEYQFSDRKTHSALQIENSHSAQKFKVRGRKTAYVDFTVVDIYPAPGSPWYFAVDRIEIFKKTPGL
jgi:hypothetical protein